MKKLAFTLAVVVSALFTFAMEKENNKSLENQEAKKVNAQSTCHCGTILNLGG